LPTTLRNRLLRRALSFQPQAVVANGDHVYWDLLAPANARTLGTSPQAVQLAGTFNRSEIVLGSDNEAVLKRAAGPQIVSVYGTDFRSTPVFFIQDDHDYFDNDEATDEVITFPPSYFMLQLAPPGEGDLERDVLPDGQPLQLLILADTSASMDADQRTAQLAFVSALLASLTPRDTVNLASCDVDCDWVFEKAVPADARNVAAVRQSLARRTSLGWTDLDRAFASALAQCEPDTQVVYVGDGIITTGDADAVAFTKRLRRLYEKHGKIGTFHAVSPGSSYESGVLKAIASLGGGSGCAAGSEACGAATAPPSGTPSLGGGAGSTNTRRTGSSCFSTA